MYGIYQGYGYQPSYSAPNYMQRSYNQQPQQIPQMQNQPQVQMQPQTPISQFAPAEMPIQDIKYVNKAQAEAYIVYPNTKVMLIDKECGIVYLKTADGMGQSKTDYFRFEPINADGSPIKPQEPTPQVNFDDFVKKEDLQKLGFVSFEQFKTLADNFEQMKKRLEGVKNNVSTKQPETRV